MMQMARLVSAEGAQLVERQTCALFGNLKQLQRQMQVCPDCCKIALRMTPAPRVRLLHASLSHV